MRTVAECALAFACAFSCFAVESLQADELDLHVRFQIVAGVEEKRPRFETQSGTRQWDATKTAIVVCDMWDEHWCRGATQRVAEMAPRMNRAIKAARSKGVMIIHCPSSCMEAYANTPMRKRASDAKAMSDRGELPKPKKPLQRWCWLDKDRESLLPIDDSDGGCDCSPPCEMRTAWTKQIATVEIDESDSIADDESVFHLMQQNDITNVIVMGVHTNMCVLGRPFSIRQMVDQGQNVVLVRDLTDAMYNSKMSPYVNHFAGTRLVVQHIERHWCPTILSTDLDGEPEFRFRGDPDSPTR